MTEKIDRVSTEEQKVTEVSNSLSPEALAKLTAFGLSENEAKVYIYLLERGTEAGGSKIAEETGIHRQYVYHVLPHLLELGLIEEVAHGKQHKYRAKSLSQIEKVAKRKMVEAEEVIRTLEKFSKVGHEQEFEVVEGREAIQKYEIERVASLAPETAQYFIGGASEGFFSLMGRLYENEYAPMANKKKLQSFFIGYKGEYKEALHEEEVKRAHFEFRFLEKFPKGVVNIMIMNDTVSFYTFVKPPILYVVKSEIVAANFKQFFDMLWNMAKPYKEL